MEITEKAPNEFGKGGKLQLAGKRDHIVRMCTRTQAACFVLIRAKHEEGVGRHYSM